jgi:hypothetical protein
MDTSLDGPLLQLAEHGFLANELHVGCKEWTHNWHPVRQGERAIAIGERSGSQ